MLFRSRIAIARAIIRNPSVLLLDEATSALDQTTEAAINRTLLKVAKDRTMIWSTHRLTSVVAFDRIVVLAVNDHHVMKAWSESLGGQGKADFVADGDGDYARALGLEIAIPGLGKLPFLSLLFGARESRTEQTELFVIATPRVTTPESALNRAGIGQASELADQTDQHTRSRLERAPLLESPAGFPAADPAAQGSSRGNR